MTVSATSLTRTSAIVSSALALGLGAAAYIYKSDLALAQAADSLMDCAAAGLLAWAVRVAQTPGDERHPMGHGRAEPLGALAIAALAGVLAIEVGTSAVSSLMGEPDVKLTWTLLGLFLAKMVFKALILKLSRQGSGSAYGALAVDARNDLVVSFVAVVGFFGARAGFPIVDPILALPAAAWIGWSGVELARENIDLLLGVAPSSRRQEEFLRIAASVEGIEEAHELTAHSTGVAYSLHVHVTVDESLTVRQGHDLAEKVRERLLTEDDVSHCSIHVDPSGQDPDVESTLSQANPA